MLQVWYYKEKTFQQCHKVSFITFLAHTYFIWNMTVSKKKKKKKFSFMH